MLRGRKPQALQSLAGGCSRACVDTYTGHFSPRLADGHPRAASLPAAAEAPGHPQTAWLREQDSAQIPPDFVFPKGQDPWVSATADAAATQILKSEGRADGASLAQMSRASGLRSGPTPQISATERPQKASPLSVA